MNMFEKWNSNVDLKGLQEDVKKAHQKKVEEFKQAQQQVEEVEEQPTPVEEPAEEKPARRTRRTR